MKINIFVSGLAGLVLAACGQENNTNNNSNGNNDRLDGGYSDSGYVNDGGKDVDGGQGNLPPVLTLEIRDYITKEIKTNYKVGEKALFYVTAMDPDCNIKNTCGNSAGIASCKLYRGTSSSNFVPNEEGRAILSSGTFTASGVLNLYVQCKDIDEGLETKSDVVVVTINN